MRQYILFAQKNPNTGKDTWLIQNIHNGEYVFRSVSAQKARDYLIRLEAAE
jgi:hypothetical protein